MKKFLIIYCCILSGIPGYMFGQVYHGCPLHPGRDYEHPLYDKWLSAYDVGFYHIDLAADNQSTAIEGFVTMHARTVKPFDTLVFELGDNLTVTDIIIDSAYHPEAKHENNTLFIPLTETKNPGELISSTIYYNGIAGSGRGFFSGISNATDTKYGADVTYTLSEPQNAKDWFPVKQVLQDKIDSAWVFITCEKSLMAGSNGVLEEVEPVSLSKHRFKWKTRYPMAYYLLSFTVADYSDYSFMAPLSEAGDSVLVQNYIYDHPQVLKDWKDDILNTGNMIQLFSELMVDYPFASEKYGHAMAPMGGGMEHQTMTTLANFGFTLVAHELAHQWFGDYITCGNWQDIWINEGFASYMEYVALENLVGKTAASEWMGQAMSVAMSDKDGSIFVPEEDAEDPYRIFSFPLSYKKGAVLLHMIRYEINNDEVFFEVLKTYISEYANGLATAENFREVLEGVTGIDFSCFFDQWYYGHGYPNFSISWYQKLDTVYVFSSQTTTTELTPLFQTHFNLLLTGKEEEYSVRLFQSENENIFSIPVTDLIMDIEFDPGNYLLNSSSVRQQIGEDTMYTFGPNPFTDEIYLRFKNFNSDRHLVITSLDGKKIRHYRIEENPVYLDMSELKDGPYLMVIKDGDSQILEKIIKVSE